MSSRIERMKAAHECAVDHLVELTDRVKVCEGEVAEAGVAGVVYVHADDASQLAFDLRRVRLNRGLLQLLDEDNDWVAFRNADLHTRAELAWAVVTFIEYLPLALEERALVLGRVLEVVSA